MLSPGESISVPIDAGTCDGIVMLAARKVTPFYELGRRYRKARLVFAGVTPTEAGRTGSRLTSRPAAANADTGRIPRRPHGTHSGRDLCQSYHAPGPGEIADHYWRLPFPFGRAFPRRGAEVLLIRSTMASIPRPHLSITSQNQISYRCP
jgi:hypothetical protein